VMLEGNGKHAFSLLSFYFTKEPREKGYPAEI
jgi:hypothetical protein